MKFLAQACFFIAAAEVLARYVNLRDVGRLANYGKQRGPKCVKIRGACLQINISGEEPWLKMSFLFFYLAFFFFWRRGICKLTWTVTPGITLFEGSFRVGLDRKLTEALNL